MSQRLTSGWPAFVSLPHSCQSSFYRLGKSRPNWVSSPVQWGQEKPDLRIAPAQVPESGTPCVRGRRREKKAAYASPLGPGSDAIVETRRLGKGSSLQLEIEGEA